MKTLITAAMLLAFSGVLVGCEASAKVGDPNDTSSTTVRRSDDSYEKKTTTVREPDGDVRTKTEINRNP